MKKSKPQTPNMETPLLLPILTPMHPFRDDREHFVTGIGEYILSGDAYTVLKNTVGLPVIKSRLKAFLAKECNISDPTHYSFPDIIAALQLHIEQNRCVNSTDKPLLSDRQLEVWNSLKGNCLSAKELAKSLGLSEENIRKHIQAIRKKYGKKSIENTRSRGYWRPDEPPSDSMD